MTDKNKKHLNFDLDFLESVDTKAPDPVVKKEADGPVSVEVTTRKSENSQSKPINWKTILIVIGVIVFFIWIANSSDSSSNTTTSTSGCDTSKLASLKPSDSDSSTIDSLKNSIDSTLVNHYSQYSVDQYNAKVDEYNNLKNAYNSKVDAYNNYLNTYCKN